MVGVQQAIYRLIEEQINTVMLANVREEYAFKVIDPAVVPDIDQYEWPKRALILVLGAGLGLLFALMIALVRSAYLVNEKSRLRSTERQSGS